MNFQTPIWVAEYMVSMISENGCHVLEPTPGEGNIVKCLLSSGYKVTAPEGFEDIIGSRFDYIVMNPPFSPMSLGYEFLYACMEMSDNIIALMPWLTIINSEKRTKDIMGFGLKSITHLPRHVFKGSRVQCCVLNMSKDYVGETMFYYLQPKFSKS